MNSPTSSYLKSKFREYYLLTSMEAPPGLESREWGFIHFDQGGMRRHKSFSGRMELVDYIRSTIPAHVYYSAAYYQRPGASTMKEKMWKGADLIFDLDADHLKRAPRSYRDMLENVKQETMKLLDFLLQDFGFSKDCVQVVFSGGRGYHIHVRDPRVFSLGSDSRREIVDYLTGRGLDVDRFFAQASVGGDCGIERAVHLRAPSRDAPGWGSRINRSMVSFVRYLQDLDEESALAELTRVKGIGEKKAATFYECLRSPGVLEKIEEGNLDLFRGSSGLWKLLIGQMEGEGVRLAPFLDDLRGETDEPVTADVKRLIRFPDSLHGGSGLRVTPLTLDGLRAFDPLRDAVAFGDEPVDVELSRPFQVEMKGRSYDLEAGPARVPVHVGVFLMARGVAELGQRAGIGKG
ncbi:MAG: DNA primase catalytic subunit PriS [Methanosarcinales archaeon]|nr:DNA primase catalytic subunit PriS [Methanosarcinales archaeon]